MKLTILEDATKRPELFSWAGAVQPSVLESWLKDRAWKIPEDLKYLWFQTGGGDFFYDGETIFAAFSDLYASDSVDEVNKYQISRGMPRHYLAFHAGLRFSAVSLTKSMYVFLATPEGTLRTGKFAREPEGDSLVHPPPRLLSTQLPLLIGKPGWI